MSAQYLGISIESQYMPKTRKIEHRLVKEFGKLSPEAKGEVFEYLRWVKDIEARERVREFKANNPKGQKRKFSREPIS